MTPDTRGLPPGHRVLPPDKNETMALIGESAWASRWTVTGDWDANANGVVTIGDLWANFLWFFNAPGDLILTALMRFAPGVAVFFELTTPSIGGPFSLVLGAVVVVIAAIVLAALSDELIITLLNTCLVLAGAFFSATLAALYAGTFGLAGAYFIVCLMFFNAPRGFGE